MQQPMVQQPVNPWGNFNNNANNVDPWAEPVNTGWSGMMQQPMMQQTMNTSWSNNGW